MTDSLVENDWAADKSDTNRSDRAKAPAERFCPCLKYTVNVLLSNKKKTSCTLHPAYHSLYEQEWLNSKQNTQSHRAVFRNGAHPEYKLYDFRSHHSNDAMRCCYKWLSSTVLSEVCHLIGSNGVRSMMVIVGVRSFLAPVPVRYPVCESQQNA